MVLEQVFDITIIPQLDLNLSGYGVVPHVHGLYGMG
jgi:hypothetical protein